MRSIGRFFARLIHQDRGGETMEYALIVGLIIATAVAVIGAIGTKVFGRWSPH
jgi:Flp pilus assembly pilin Flp